MTDPWKKNLLKSSLPLEQLVSKKLEEHGLYVRGEYPYTRQNEQNIDTVFSVDLHAFDLVRRRKGYWGILNVLIECKYNHPGVQWVFAPFPSGSAVIIGGIRCLEELCYERIGKKKPLQRLDHELQFCTRGIELHEHGFDANTISHGLHQLRYALPNLVAQEYLNQATTPNEEDVHISFICPIMVTTASLHILRDNIDLQTYQNASSLDEVAYKVDALIVHQEKGLDLYKYCNKVAKTLHEQQPEISLRLTKVEQAARAHEEHPIVIEKTTKPIDWQINHEWSNILVMRFDALDIVLDIIRDSVMKAGRSIRPVSTADLK